jgi:hypothetical protein
MLKKLKQLTPKLGKSASTNGIQTQSELFQPPLGPNRNELPEIRVQVEEPSNFYEPVAPQPCMTCGPLTACTEQPVPKEALLSSANNGCSICSLLWTACIQVQNIDRFDYISTWSSIRSIFGVYLIKKCVEDENEVAGRTVTVMVLASNGGKCIWLA